MKIIKIVGFFIIIAQPCGSDIFVKLIEKSLGVKLTASSVGRPRINKLVSVPN